MIVPSIDLMGGHAVQLVGGKELELDAGDPRPLATTFGRVGEVAVVDLDAALGRGTNAPVIHELLRLAPCRVGGGIRDAAAARAWLDAGAARLVIGTAATTELLSQLPRERVIAALDAVEGEVVVDGWRTRTGRSVPERMRELRDRVSGFLVTFVEKEGRMGGTRLDRVPELVEAAGAARVTIAGGVTTPDDVAALDRMGADAQIGMALYTGRLPLADAFLAPLASDRPDDLWPTVVVDERGVALGLVYSARESVARALETGRGVYWSRRRGLWEKGAESGHGQRLVRIEVDCDRDALTFVVAQDGPFCHLGTRGCFGPARGLGALEATVAARVADAPAGSYTRRLLDDPALLAAKLREEAGELAEASASARSAAEAGLRDAVVRETADVLYFATVALAAGGGTLAAVEAELDRRALGVTRRPGDAKPEAGR
jgi:phosphoribosyl-ATP pyrophosphohydrolase/phosphoribosyl-AMP cyclohydrolase